MFVTTRSESAVVEKGLAAVWFRQVLSARGAAVAASP